MSGRKVIVDLSHSFVLGQPDADLSGKRLVRILETFDCAGECHLVEDQNGQKFFIGAEEIVNG